MTRLEENRFRSLPPRLLANYPHYVVSGNKLSKYVDTGTSLRDDIAGSELGLLTVGIKTPRTLGRGIDPVTDLVSKKRQWRLELERQLRFLKRRRRSDVAATLHTFNKFLSHGESGAIMSEREVKFIKHIGKDPDAEFDGCCNWYYSGGQLNHFEIEGNVILTSVQGKKSDCLYFIPLNKKKPWSAKLGAAAFVSPVRGKPIFQVVSSDLGYTVARCKNHINLYRVKLDEDVIVGNKCFTASSKEPFVSVDVNTKYREQICSVHMDHNLCVWDVNTHSKLSEHVPSHCSPSMCEKWCAAAFGLSPHSLYFSDRSCVSVFDLRTRPNKHVARWCVGDCKLIEKCECIFSIVSSVQCANSMYVGTTHHMLALDIRRNSIESSECWTHMLRTPPLYGCCSVDEKEILVMASQESSEVEVFSGGVLLPVMLQTFADCLRRSSSRGHNLEPEVQQRFGFSISGLTCFAGDASKLPTVLVQNAAGDIFLHKLHGGSDLSLRGNCDVGRHLPRKCSRSRLKVGNILKMRYLQAALKSSSDSMKQDVPDETIRLTDKRFTWMKSKEKLLS
ncbi:hypothetical protein PR048_003449 [Dryococelus australis]|uniref:Uncharacterized protein n=1 Tax=Dryococelus australis TaxID=614101 RepID=A0ABQ9IPG1_9NEOP|nr:hypothetical protein PR048_003449 [Dryococelus australis]